MELSKAVVQNACFGELLCRQSQIDETKCAMIITDDRADTNTPHNFSENCSQPNDNAMSCSISKQQRASTGNCGNHSQFQTDMTQNPQRTTAGGQMLSSLPHHVGKRENVQEPSRTRVSLLGFTHTQSSVRGDQMVHVVVLLDHEVERGNIQRPQHVISWMKIKQMLFTRVTINALIHLRQ
jgi:hypothetical protein